MQKHLIISLITVLFTLSYVIYEKLNTTPVEYEKVYYQEYTIDDDEVIWIDGKFYEEVNNSMLLDYAPVGKYKIGEHKFEITNNKTTVAINLIRK